MHVEGFDRWAAGYDGGALQPGLYHAMHQDVLREVRNLRRDPRRAMDLGCGTGQLLRRAANLFPECLLVGVDASAAMLARAACNAPTARLVRAHAAALPFATNAFDVITCTATVRHWPNVQAGLIEATRVLADGGILIIADFFPPQPRSAWPTLRRTSTLPAGIQQAVHSARLHLASIREISGYGPIAQITVAVAHS